MTTYLLQNCGPTVASSGLVDVMEQLVRTTGSLPLEVNLVMGLLRQHVKDHVEAQRAEPQEQESHSQVGTEAAGNRGAAASNAAVDHS